MEEFKDEYRCITMDLRNANSGQSSGSVQVEKPWDAYADDQLGLRVAIEHADEGDIVVIAGKGNEQGQEFADRKIPFDDREVAREALRALRAPA